MKNNKKMLKKYIKALSNIFLWTRPTNQWQNMLQILERQRKNIGDVLSDEHTLYQKVNIRKIFMFCCSSFFKILSLIKIKVVDFTLLLWSADAFAELNYFINVFYF